MRADWERARGRMVRWGGLGTAGGRVFVVVGSVFAFVGLGGGFFVRVFMAILVDGCRVVGWDGGWIFGGVIEALSPSLVLKLLLLQFLGRRYAKV